MSKDRTERGISDKVKSWLKQYTDKDDQELGSSTHNLFIYNTKCHIIFRDHIPDYSKQPETMDKAVGWEMKYILNIPISLTK